ncbi:MAG: HAMP domain-containing histidine kinase [Bacteroidetes bacterium]|nr:HAMP domain-containing histidine kinase [Bacteroidota bacterium]
MPKRNLLYFVFAAFLLIIFVRWGVLVHQKNRNAYNDKLALYDLIIDIDTSETTRQLYDQEVTRLNEQYQRQKITIATEALIFLVLLLLGIIRVFIYFKKEIDLALQQSNFLLSITHELKSPLASALLNIQTLLKRNQLDVERQQKLLSNSHEELERLRALVDKLLLAAKMDGKEIVYEKSVLNISELYQKVFDNYFDQYKDHYRMTASIEPELQIMGDPILIASIFTNLMDNAIKYCQTKGQIEVSLKGNDRNVILTVKNDGRPISKIDKTRVWDKFYRIGDENTRSTKGTGLGLYIVKEVVEAHNGQVGIVDSSEGVIFKITFPGL